MKTIQIKRPRRLRTFRPFLSARNCDHHHVCEHCAAFAEQAESERPGHVWTIIEDRLVFIEDHIAETMLGRPLLPTEAVIHRDGNVLNNNRANLEIVAMPNQEKVN